MFDLNLDKQPPTLAVETAYWQRPPKEQYSRADTAMKLLATWHATSLSNKYIMHLIVN